MPQRFARRQVIRRASTRAEDKNCGFRDHEQEFTALHQNIVVNNDRSWRIRVNLSCLKNEYQNEYHTNYT